MGGYGVPSVDIPDAGMPVGASGSVLTAGGMASLGMTVIFGSMTMPSMERVVDIGTIVICGSSGGYCGDEPLTSTYDSIPAGIPEMDIGIGDYSENILNGTQFGLSVVTMGGLFFGPPGLVFSSVAGAANGLISMARGNYVSGGIGVALSVFPLIGMLGKIGKVGEAIQWNPLNGPGPLGESIANTFRSATYTEMVTTETTTFYRVYGGSSAKLGSFWSRTAPSGSLQSVIDGALNQQWGNTANLIVKIEVPAGTRIFEGAAAAQGNLVGGGSQVYMPTLNPNWLIP